MDYGLSSSSLYQHGDIVKLNVGGRRFTTSRQTLTWVQDSFFSSLLSGRIPSLKDEAGAIFVDRDPDVFVPILHFLRSREVNLRGMDVKTLRSEAEFYSITPLVKRLMLCEDVTRTSCGGILFVGSIAPPIHLSTLDGPPSALLPPYKLSSDVNKNVRQIVCHGNCMATVYAQVIFVYSLGREGRGWDLVYTSPLLDRAPQHVSLRTKVGGGSHLGDKLLAAVLGTEVRVWTCSPTQRELTTFEAKFQVDHMFFIGSQLVVLGNAGKVAVWQSVTRHWQIQGVAPICSFDSAGSFLLLGCTNGSIYHIDMEKFPLRMKDNDLLVSQLFEDPNHEAITTLSVYLTPAVYNGGFNQQWIEIAYGTSSGSVKVIVQHPENVGQGPQVFDTFTVHTCSLSKVVLGEKHLVSVCADNHVRTWNVTRFRGRISTQPGSSSLSSYKVLSIDGPHSLLSSEFSIGPYGEVGEEQVFIQRVVPETSKLFVRLCSTGHRICDINSVDGSNLSACSVHEFEGANRLGSRSRRYVITGHSSGNIQLWDLTTAIELCSKTSLKQSGAENDGGPTQEELLDMLYSFDISASRSSSSVNSRAPSPSPSLFNVICSTHRPNPAGPTTPIFHRMGLRGSGRQIVPVPLRSVSESPHPPPSSQSVWTDGPLSRHSGHRQGSVSRLARPKPEPFSLSDTELPRPLMVDTPQNSALLKVPAKWNDIDCSKPDPIPTLSTEDDVTNDDPTSVSPLPAKVSSLSSLRPTSVLPVHSRTLSAPHKTRVVRVHSHSDHTTSLCGYSDHHESNTLAGSSPSLLRPSAPSPVTRQGMKKLLQSDLPASDC